MDSPRGPILVVDDNDDFRALAVELLERAGFETLGAESGADALAIAAETAPRLVVLDVNLPRTSGYTVCNELRQRLGRHLPIMFVSGDRTEPFDRVAGLLIGADDYLSKPFEGDEFVARVARLAETSSFRGRELDEPYGLTPRELEVLVLLGDGLTQADIALRLYLSPKTIGTHIQRILGKMRVNSRTQAVALAARDGMFELTRS